MPLEKKIETIAQQIYGADGIELSEEAAKRMELFKKQVCASDSAAKYIELTNYDIPNRVFQFAYC